MGSYELLRFRKNGSKRKNTYFSFRERQKTKQMKMGFVTPPVRI